MRQLIILAAAAALAACGQPGGNEAANQAAAAPPKEKTPYCFFKDSEAKGWSASAGKDGNVTVKGKLYREDPRYKAILDKPKVAGSVAEVWPGVAQNDTGFAADGNWWNVTLTIPSSAAVTRVDVRCGAKTLASIAIKRKN